MLEVGEGERGHTREVCSLGGLCDLQRWRGRDPSGAPGGHHACETPRTLPSSPVLERVAGLFANPMPRAA